MNGGAAGKCHQRDRERESLLALFDRDRDRERESLRSFDRSRDLLSRDRERSRERSREPPRSRRPDRERDRERRLGDRDRLNKLEVLINKRVFTFASDGEICFEIVHGFCYRYFRFPILHEPTGRSDEYQFVKLERTL